MIHSAQRALKRKILIMIKFDSLFRNILIPTAFVLVITILIGNMSIVYTNSIKSVQNSILGYTIDRNPPEIHELKPQDGEVEEEEVIISGITDFNVIVSVNGIVITEEGGKFSYIHTLSLGENTFLVEAKDAAGNATTTTISINRIDPCKDNKECGKCENPECPQQVVSNKSTPANTACDLNFNIELMNLINEYRGQNNLVQLEMDYNLNNASCSHSKWMHTTGNVTHNGENGSTPWDRCADAGSYCDGEIITLFITQPIQALNKWKVSTPHNNNMLNPNWRGIGLGESGGYVAVVFRK